ncbi:MAG: glycine dehydrogenase (aminomethyl-transferring) [Planctomycetota bacterium]|nr:MAG: glycine dehydrogenase (aminomethyl-transferring) [Planctomycetota bacterium]
MSKPFPRYDRFESRHLGPRPGEVSALLKPLGAADLEELMDRVIPPALQSQRALKLGEPLSEKECLEELRSFAEQNEVWRSYLGMGYSDSILPGVIQRNILENPGWYTQYTPYQAEISQGRLEALLNFQTMVSELTQMEVANASMLDEATAAAEAMTLCRRVLGRKGEGRGRFVASSGCHPQTLAVLQTRAEPLGIEIVIADTESYAFGDDVFGVLLQYPDTSGQAQPLSATIDRIHEAGALAVVACDLLALTQLEAPGTCGADIVVGNSQRFGVPLGYGGPHAAFFAAREAYKRQMPGRIVGVSVDRKGRPALRLALATREQHIRREKATSNICTAQVLLAIMASMYAIYHGPKGLRAIAERIRRMTEALATGLSAAGHKVRGGYCFDTLRIDPKGGKESILAKASEQQINLREFEDGSLGISLDETVEHQDLCDLMYCFGGTPEQIPSDVKLQELPAGLARTTEYLTHPVFSRYHSETELLRYIFRLQEKDLSLTHTMIPLGSCTMKLNATAEMIPVSWPGFSKLHPFAPPSQALGYAKLHQRLESMLADITGFDAVSLQPNAGSQGEYSGLLVIRAYHRAHGQEQRQVCLIPSSAHGTNPASATMAGMKVVVVACDERGNIDVADLRAKAEKHADELAALMVTYPSTHGVFESSIKEICQLIHEHGGQVYMDGANLNAQIGHLSPGELGADVCHLNLHKTFAIPHGGGGPGMGPIGVAKHLESFLPSHPLVQVGGEQGIGAVSAAPWGSPSILPISYAYIRMMGSEGLKLATEYAILGANYIAGRLEEHYPVLYKGESGLVAHECILDMRPLEKSAGVTVADIAKRLSDYGFHAPTMSFPVAGTLMVEPTESESKQELDRFCEAMIGIREEIRAIENGSSDREDNLLKNAPHSAEDLTAEEWTHPYSREQAAYPTPHTRAAKFWPPVARIDDVYGDRHFVCSCPPMAAYE